VRTLIDNVDLRWDWFFGPNEVLSVSGFYKHFTAPIEESLEPSAQVSVTYKNAGEANNVGIELEWRKNFGFIVPALEDLYIAGNVSFIYSQVRLDDTQGIATSGKRPLQSQSPYIGNISLGYSNPVSGTDVTLLFNLVGPAIREVGAFGFPDTYKGTYSKLDLVLGQKLPKGFAVKLQFDNILDTFQSERTGEVVTERVRKGWKISAGLSFGK